jgi:hypothetical protein
VLPPSAICIGIEFGRHPSSCRTGYSGEAGLSLLGREAPEVTDEKLKLEMLFGEIFSECMKFKTYATDQFKL